MVGWKKAVLSLGLGLSLLLSGQAQSPNLYPRDLAVILMSENDVETETSLAGGFNKIEETAPSLLGPPVVPLGELPVTETADVRLRRPPKQWEVPPFPSLEPALPKDLPPEVKDRLERESKGSGAQAPVFGDVAPYNYEVSAELRPRSTAGNPLSVEGGDAPTPFSLRRYQTSNLGFVQVAVYGGTTSIRAEQIYQSLRAAALNREPLQGFGKESFLARIPVPVARQPQPTPAKPPVEPSPAPSPEAGATPDSRGFDDIAVMGPARPDLVDRGMAESASAPSFKGVPTVLQPKSGGNPANDDQQAEDDLATDSPSGPPTELTRSPLQPNQGDGPSMLVLVAYFPDRAAVLEMAVDERIASLQQLLNLALKAQTRLGEVWSEQTQR